jgi:FkbM family methyltransferase
MTLSRTAAKQRIAALGRHLGYAVTRRRGPDAALFYALCDRKGAAHAESDPALAAFVRACIDSFSVSHAQRFQDVLADFVMQGRAGRFCEFGATDGASLSNTAMLEIHRGWSGILAEPGRQWTDALRANRPGAKIDTRCVYSVSGQRLTFSEAPEAEYSGIAMHHSADAHGARRREAEHFETESVSLDDLLTDHGFEQIDYLSVDTEGSEFIILENFDFGRFRPILVTVEHNFSGERDKLYDLLTGNGMRRIFEELSGFDDWYVCDGRLAADHPLRRQG